MALDKALKYVEATHANQLPNRSSHVSAKLPLLPNQETEDALAAARNAPPVPVAQQIIQEIKSLYPVLLLCRPQFRTFSFPWCRGSFQAHFEECLDSANLVLLACAPSIGTSLENNFGDSNLSVQVVAHIAATAVPHTVLQHLRSVQVTPLAKPAGGHRPLLMMSFLHRLALKSVMAAKQESVAKCAGSLQYAVGRPAGANTMIKTIQYKAEVDPTRVLVAVDLKAAFQNLTTCHATQH